MVASSPFIIWIPLVHLLAFAANILAGKRLGKKAAWVSVGACLVSCLAAWPLIVAVIRGSVYQDSIEWILIGKTPLSFGYFLDPAAAIMLFVVTFIGTLIQIYSVGYMHDDARFSRFFAYLSLFMAAMLTLVIANNYLLFFMAWEVMGLCSYLLIGFWFEKPSAANASKKAFLTTRVGDVGFFLGILTLAAATGSLNFSTLSLAVGRMDGVIIPAAALLIFLGTVGKSAQIPLHVWLPDAMEGPTPVSALIHAATMVAAGVYLLVRSFPLLEAAPVVMDIITWTGTATALMAALIALTATDIKKVLAYSTISQLGYMVAAMGLGGMNAGMFHLTTHAFFKALLFMAAGSVIHGTGTQNIEELGGLFGKMKSTAWTFLIASLAIAGVPPLSGFWSKDEILVAAVHYEKNEMIYWLLLFTAFLTAFYMFRLFFLTFLGKARNPKVHAHESPRSMTVPLWLLAAGSIFIGIPGSPWMHQWYQGFLSGPEFHPHEPDMKIILASVAVGLAGVLLSAVFYLWAPGTPGKLARVLAPLHAASRNKFWWDELYAFVIVRPFHGLGRVLFWFDRTVVDRLVNETAAGTYSASLAKAWFDRNIVDGLVNLTGYATQFSSAVLRRIQTGLIQHYLLIVFAGLIVLIYFGVR